MKQWILVKFLCDRVYFWAIFYATGYRVLSGLPHTPVTSLVKYPPPPRASISVFKFDVLEPKVQSSGLDVGENLNFQDPKFATLKAPVPTNEMSVLKLTVEDQIETDQ